MGISRNIESLLFAYRKWDAFVRIYANFVRFIIEPCPLLFTKTNMCFFPETYSFNVRVRKDIEIAKM